MNKNRLQSNLSKAKGLGSTREGTDHFIDQRITALALIPLVFWFCFSLAFLPQMDYQGLIAWLRSPLNSVLLIIISLVVFYHLQLGLQIIIEDYVSTYLRRLISIILMKFLCIFLAITSVFTLLRISFLL